MKETGVDKKKRHGVRKMMLESEEVEVSEEERAGYVDITGVLNIIQYMHKILYALM